MIRATAGSRAARWSGITKSRDRIHVTKALHIRVVAVAGGRAQHEEVAFIAFGAEPPERLIQILAATHHGRARLDHGADILRIAHAHVGVRSRKGPSRAADERQGAEHDDENTT